MIVTLTGPDDLLLYDSGIVAVLEIQASHIDDLAAWDNVIEII